MRGAALSFRGRIRPVIPFLLVLAWATWGAPLAAARPYPILFVTQVPIPYDFTTIGSVFGNHLTEMQSVGRGGDLWILYPNGNARNLTAAAGYGVASGFQGATSIAVREPAVHWSGTKAIFSMVVGAPAQQYQWGTWYWRMYEITGLGEAETPVITLVANQPMDANNVSPLYAADGRILFTSDRSRDGRAHLYPQLDEYEEAPTVSGIWSLDPASGDLRLLDHSPSGDFKPTIDSWGRVIFTRWDHLQRDQQADSDYYDVLNGDPPAFGTFNWAGENPLAPALATREEQFPEPRSDRTDLLAPNENGHEFNQFFPWMMRQDGTELETIDHVGRHELHTYFAPNFNDDDNLEEFSCSHQYPCGRHNDFELRNMLQIRESASVAGRYFGVDAPEFYTHSGGQVVSMDAGAALPADQIEVAWITHRDTANFDDTPAACHSGFYRSPLQLSAPDGSLVAVHAGMRTGAPTQPETRQAANDGTRANPVARYKFRMTELVDDPACAGYKKSGAPLLAAPITKSLWFWDPDVQVTYTDVALWELDPVEVRARPAPDPPPAPLDEPEQSIFDDEEVDVAAFRQFLEERDLALVVSRDVTTRDEADRQQPWVLRVPPAGHQTPQSAAGTVYDVEYLQFFQGDLIRGVDGPETPSPGRRVLAQRMHDPLALNPPLDPGDPPSSVEVGDDGSAAALVPAHRALTWQLVSGSGAPVVRERYWLTFQKGEIRVCASCHGLNSADQAGQQAPANPPEALRRLLQWWKTLIFSAHFEGGNLAEWSSAGS